LGFLGESWIRAKYRDKGYKIEKIKYEYSNLIRKSAIKYLLFKQPDKDNILKVIEKNIIGFPDYICVKGMETFFLEVKTNRGVLSKQQEETIEIIKSKGYEVVIETVKIPVFKIEYEDEGNIKKIEFRYEKWQH